MPPTLHLKIRTSRSTTRERGFAPGELNESNHGTDPKFENASEDAPLEHQLDPGSLG